jgi:hypothetical protein
MAAITLENTKKSIKLAREIRNLNNKKSSTLVIDFTEDNQKIHINGEIVYLPITFQIENDCLEVHGEVMNTQECLCIVDMVRPKTVNVHLDSELVGEINAIREFIFNNKDTISSPEIKDTTTQHEVLLAALRRGVNQIKKDFRL